MPTASQSIRDIVTAEPSTAAVFERFEIDLCSRADQQLDQACAALQLSVDQVLEKLSDAEGRAHGAHAPDLDSYSAGRLIQHIVRTHHQTVRQELPRLVDLSKRIATKHGGKAPHFNTVAVLLDQLCTEMFAHLQKEERVLFPYIVEMEEAAESSRQASSCCFPSVAQPIAMMMHEHDSAEAIVEELSRVTHGFKPPEWACARNTAFHGSMAEFRADLHQHVHVENDLLFPRAIALEAEL